MDSFLFKPSRSEWDSPGGIRGCVHELSSLEALTWKRYLRHFVCELCLRSLTDGLLHHPSFGEKFCYHGAGISWDDSTCSPSSSVNDFTYHCLWSWLLPPLCSQNLQAPLPVEMVSAALLLLRLKSMAMNRIWLWRANAVPLYFQTILWTRFLVPYLSVPFCYCVHIVSLWILAWVFFLAGVGEMLIWLTETTKFSLLRQFPGCLLGR